MGNVGGVTIPDPRKFVPTIRESYQNYHRLTETKCKILDLYIMFIIMTAATQLGYYVVIGTTFPFNSLLSGVISCIGSFVLAVSLRLQIVNPVSNREFDFTPERAFADFVLGNILLHFIVLSYVG